jgi:cyanophycin synthetase
MKKKDIEFLRVTHLRGPNIWTYRPVLEAWVDIGDLEDAPSNTIPGFYERLIAWLPGLIEHRCGVGERGGFLLRLKEGTWPAHILEHVAIELQNLAGMRVGFGKARQTAVRGVYKVAVRTRHEALGRTCLQAARDLVMAAIEDRPFDLAATVGPLREMADRYCLGPSTLTIVDAAGERKIPSIRLTDGNLVQLGYGVHQHRIWTAETDRTSAIAEGIASDKDLTKTLLKACGVPVPEGELVDSPEAAWQAAQDIGLPVVVKPVDGNHGRGVSLDLSERTDIEAAYKLAEVEGSEVIVEQFIPGNEHRLLVVGNRLVAAARGESAWVEGDGRASVVELIEHQLNSDPRRGTTEDYPLNHILIDEDPAVRLELARQGFTGDSVPAAGQKVLIQRNGNVAFDVTEQVHPSTRHIAGLAARVIGLDIAGIDLVVEDISRPLAEQRGAIVEVNAGPGLLMHLKPAEGKPQPVGQAIVDHLFPADSSGRIPVVGIAGSAGGAIIGHLLSRLLQLTGKQVGLACSDGLYLNRRQATAGDCANWKMGQRLLRNRAVEAAIFENGAGMILSEGLAYDRCQVGIVTDIPGPEGFADYYLHEPGQMYTVLRTQVDVVLAEGAAVLNADEPEVARMAELSDGAVIFYSLDATSPVLAEHRSEGGWALFARDSRIFLAKGREESTLADLGSLPHNTEGEPALALRHALPAIAAAVALGLSPELIQAGIETFEPSQLTGELAPARP